ncbi:phage head-tail joining protein [Hansschlegelia zhihuaiae]|uniref:Uncharacterized protein n=1 Tax=Hansschlegelia zhihuaiae TaxID=405005 RepID=A0A4V1KI94_9HYPH|nr:hypothetical protein [Hansschlegelia zhihuaiae]RXF69902.1 hypothetical protein EK403_18175 [Hansschlegelia zhihuaiae]
MSARDAQWLAKLRAKRDALIEARLEGVRELQDQSGERIVYRSDNEMRAAISDVNRLIQDAERASPSTIRFRTSKGLDR